MRRFAAGVAVLSLDDDGDELALTVGSLVSLSLEPALVGVSIGQHSLVLEPLRRVGRFGLSLLSGDQDGLAQHFARNVPPLARWVHVDARLGAAGPLLQGALGWLECRVASECDAGDHVFFVAQVDRVELGRDARALVYVAGGYREA